MWSRFRWYFIWLVSLVAFMVVVALASGEYIILGTAVLVIMVALGQIWLKAQD